MNENKVKVKLALGIRKYKEIEVDAKDVPTIQKVNRLIWRESDKEKRSKKQLQDAGITICSLEAVERGGAFIEDSTQSVLESLMIEETEKEKSQLCNNAMKCLTEKQRYVVYQVFWEEKTLRQIAKDLKVHPSTIADTYAAAMKKLKKFFGKS